MIRQRSDANFGEAQRASEDSDAEPSHQTGDSLLPSGSSESQPEFTARAVLSGLCIGVLLALTNMYLGLQSGWISMMSIQSALLGFAVFKVLPKRFFSSPLSVKENVVIQTTAVATGTMPLAAGLVGIIPALSQLNPEQDGSEPIVLSPVQLIGWCLAVAFFGVFLAVPLRRQVIVREKLVFPSGTATAHMISVLHAIPPPKEPITTSHEAPISGEAGYSPLPSGDNVVVVEGGDQPEEFDEKGWRKLMWSFGVSACFTILSLAVPVLYAIPVFDIFGPLAHDWLWWFTPSFSYIGQGIIMGLPTVSAMNAGMLLGWAVLSPVAKTRGWAPGPIGDSTTGARGWIIWPALAIMMAEAITSLSTVLLTSTISYIRSRRSHSRSTPDDPKEDELGIKWVGIGLTASCVLCIGLVWVIFGEVGIKWWATVLALVLASLFSLLGVRSLGETDLNPVSAIGKISQLLFAVIQPNNVVANLLAGGISEAGAQQAGDLMQDLKCGHLHSASPKAQFYGQMIGSLVSVFVSSGVYVLYRRVYELPSTAFPVPVAAVWLSLARLVNSGHLPEKTKEAMLIVGPIFLVITVLRAIEASPLLGRRERVKLWWVKFLPSGIAFAIGFINTPSFSLARFIGGLISFIYTRRRLRYKPNESSSPLENIGLVIVASGFVLGEGLASIVGLLVRSAGVGPLTCWGCGSGGGGTVLHARGDCFHTR